MEKAKAFIYLSIILLIFLILSLGHFWNKIGGYVSKENSTYYPPLSVSLILESINVRAGEDIILTVKITSPGATEAEDAHVKYRIWDKERKIKYSESSETLAVLTSVSIIRYIHVPRELPEGDYIIEVEVEHRGEKASASSWFNLSKKPFWTMQNVLYIIVIFVIVILIFIIYGLRKLKGAGKIDENILVKENLIKLKPNNSEFLKGGKK